MRLASAGTRAPMRAHVLLAAVAALALSCGHQAAPVRTPAASGTLAREQANMGEYRILFAEAQSCNRAFPNLNRWSMNAEHCLLFLLNKPPFSDENPPDNLSSRVKAFLLHPGAIDLVCSRLLDGHPTDEEVLIDAEFSIYAGKYSIGDDSVDQRAERGAELAAAAKAGIFASAEQRYPQAPIREVLEAAGKRLSGVK